MIKSVRSVGHQAGRHDCLTLWLSLPRRALVICLRSWYILDDLNIGILRSKLQTCDQQESIHQQQMGSADKGISALELMLLWP